jgi:hypothetical protein
VREIKDKEYNDSVIRIFPRGKTVMDLWDKDIVFASTLSYIYEIKKKQVTIVTYGLLSATVPVLMYGARYEDLTVVNVIHLKNCTTANPRRRYL